MLFRSLIAADTDIEMPVSKRAAAAIVLNALNAPIQTDIANETLGEFLIYRGRISKKKAKELGLKELTQPENRVDIISSPQSMLRERSRV